MQPIIASFVIDSSLPSSAPPWTLIWNCADNPPATTVELILLVDNGVPQQFEDLPLSGSKLVAADPGGSTFTFTLTASLTTNNVTRMDTKRLVAYNNQHPVITAFLFDGATSSVAGTTWTFNWDCTDSPPGTTVALDMVANGYDGPPSIGYNQHYGGLQLSGSLGTTGYGGGTFTFTLTASLTINGVTQTVTAILEEDALPPVVR